MTTEEILAEVPTAAAQVGIAEARFARPIDGPTFSAGDSRDTVHLFHDAAAAAAPYPISDLGPSSTFADTLARRHSLRALAPLDAAMLGTALARAALVRRRWQGSDGYPETSRPAPSAGARHPHVLVVLAHRVHGLDRGAWILDPDAACLRPTNHDSTGLERALGEVTDALRLDRPPPAVVFTVARLAATLTRYPSGISLLWRDAGALQSTIHLAACDLELGSCIVGTAGALHPYDGTDDSLFDTGAVAVGAKA